MAHCWRSLTKSTALENFILQIQSDKNIPADSALHLLSQWNSYPLIQKTNREYIYFYEDSFYGNVPLRIFIPSSYKNNQKNAMLLSLHGAVGASSFERMTLDLKNERSLN